jgi:tetratricopeptide (TPR) repeat protein
MVWPFGLAVFYPHPGDSLPLWKSWVAGFLLVAVSAAVVWVASRYQYLLVGWLWYLGTLVPVIGFVQVGEQAMADRYTYVPLIGLFIIVAWGVADMVQKWRHGRLVLTLSATMLLLAMMVGSWLQVPHWQNSINLFRHALRVTTSNYLAHYNLGNALALKGNLAEAIAQYNQALRISPNYPEAHNNLGNALALRGSLDEAIVHYKEALRIKPVYAEAHRNLGVGLDRQGQHVKAMHHYAEAIRIRPDDAQSHNNLGVALAEQGRLNEAIAHFTEALRINPNFTDARRNLEHGL